MRTASSRRAFMARNLPPTALGHLARPNSWSGHGSRRLDTFTRSGSGNLRSRIQVAALQGEFSTRDRMPTIHSLRALSHHDLSEQAEPSTDAWLKASLAARAARVGTTPLLVAPVCPEPPGMLSRNASEQSLPLPSAPVLHMPKSVRLNDVGGSSNSVGSVVVHPPSTAGGVRTGAGRFRSDASARSVTSVASDAGSVSSAYANSGMAAAAGPSPRSLHSNDSWTSRGLQSARQLLSWKSGRTVQRAEVPKQLVNRSVSSRNGTTGAPGQSSSSLGVRRRSSDLRALLDEQGDINSSRTLPTVGSSQSVRSSRSSRAVMQRPRLNSASLPELAIADPNSAVFKPPTSATSPFASARSWVSNASSRASASSFTSNVLSGGHPGSTFCARCHTCACARLTHVAPRLQIRYQGSCRQPASAGMVALASNRDAVVSWPW